MANSVIGVLHAAVLAIHAIGSAYAAVAQRHAKHGIKQVDRWLSNPAFDVARLAPSWIEFVIGFRNETGQSFRNPQGKHREKAHVVAVPPGTVLVSSDTTMRDDWLEKLMRAFERIIADHRVFREVFAVIGGDASEATPLPVWP